MSLSEPIITIECDECGVTDEVSLTCTARGYDERDVPKQLERLGYVVDPKDEYRHLCQDCAKSAGEEGGRDG